MDTLGNVTEGVPTVVDDIEIVAMLGSLLVTVTDLALGGATGREAFVPTSTLTPVVTAEMVSDRRSHRSHKLRVICRGAVSRRSRPDSNRRRAGRAGLEGCALT